jgi:hypothetical protein
LFAAATSKLKCAIQAFLERGLGLCKGRRSPAATINVRAKLSVSMREFVSEHHYCQILDAAADTNPMTPQ